MSFRNLYLLILLAMLVICIDQFTKFIVVEIIMQPPHIVYVLPFLNFNLHYNTGLSFGLFESQFQSSPRTLVLFTAAITAVVIFWGGLRSRSKTEAVSAGLIAGGAAGNIIDRSLRGAVTDFLDLHIANLFWPTFNLADFAIVGGALILVGASIKSDSRHEEKAND